MCDARGRNTVGVVVHWIPEPKALEAVRWYRKAAGQNNAAAQYNLGVYYYNGEGLANDYTKAVSWFRKAAEQNFASAQYNLGVCYVNGSGVAKDYVEGYKFWLLAAAQGDEDAHKPIFVVESKMSREQTATPRFEDVIKAAEQAAVLVLVY